MTRRLTDEQVQDLCDCLQGSALSLAEAIDQCFDHISETDLTLADSEEIAEQVFKCIVCDEWCQVYEMSEDADREHVCETCAG